MQQLSFRGYIQAETLFINPQKGLAAVNDETHNILKESGAYTIISTYVPSSIGEDFKPQWSEDYFSGFPTTHFRAYISPENGMDIKALQELNKIGVRTHYTNQDCSLITKLKPEKNIIKKALELWKVSL
jgi:hypothetical protein